MKINTLKEVERMGRNKSTHLNVRIEPALVNTVKRLADRQGKTMSGVVRELLIIWIKAIRAEEKKHQKAISPPKDNWLTSFFE